MGGGKQALEARPGGCELPGSSSAGAHRSEGASYLGTADPTVVGCAVCSHLSVSENRPLLQPFRSVIVFWEWEGDKLGEGGEGRLRFSVPRKRPHHRDMGSMSSGACGLGSDPGFPSLGA